MSLDERKTSTFITQLMQPEALPPIIDVFALRDLVRVHHQYREFVAPRTTTLNGGLPRNEIE